MKFIINTLSLYSSDSSSALELRIIAPTPPAAAVAVAVDNSHGNESTMLTDFQNGGKSNQSGLQLSTGAKRRDT